MGKRRIRRLLDLIRDAQAHVDRPFAPGETSRPIEFFTEFLSVEGWQLGWRLVADLRESHPRLFQIAGEEAIHREALELLRVADVVLSHSEIAERLSAALDDGGPWIVQVPLANVAMSAAWAPLGPSAAIQRSTVPLDSVAADDREARELAGLDASSAIWRHLGDRLPGIRRDMHLGSGTTVELRRSASVTSLERGTRRMAADSAAAKAYYAIATWSVLSPPQDWHLMPELATWAPQPFVHRQPVIKRQEENAWISREQRRGGDYRVWSDYPLPDNPPLEFPYRAFEALERRPAQALLSATAAVWQASRASRYQLSERLGSVRRAVECLCDPGDGGGGTSGRWQRLAERLTIWDRVGHSRAYEAADVERLQRRLVHARNITTHSARACMIDLGWSGVDHRLRAGLAAGDDLHVRALIRDLGPMVFTVSEALRIIWPLIAEAGFDDGTFEALFA